MWRFGVILCLALALAASQNADDDSSEAGVREGAKKTNCTCGWANKSPQRIVGGSETGVNEWPMMAGVIRREFLWLTNFLTCGATIITQRHVLSSAHCMHDELGKRYREKDIGIVLGVHNLRTIDYNDPNIMRTPEQIIVHPKFSWPGPWDMAVVVLPLITFSAKIGPACLPTTPLDAVNKKFKGVGWGITTAGGELADVLKKTTVEGVNKEMCKKEYPEFQESFQMCTFTSGTSPCHGDSGGPLLWLDPDTNRYTIQAVVSYGSVECHKKPLVSNEISYFLPWIQKVVSESAPEGKTCSNV